MILSSTVVQKHTCNRLSGNYKRFWQLPFPYDVRLITTMAAVGILSREPCPIITAAPAIACEPVS